MLRGMLGTCVIVCLFAATSLVANDKDKKDDKDVKANQGTKATITKVDAKKGTIEVKMKDKDGKDVQRTFKLTEDIRYFDSTGKAAAIDVFQSGNEVLIVEREGQLREIHRNRDAKTGDQKSDEKKLDKK